MVLRLTSSDHLDHNQVVTIKFYCRMGPFVRPKFEGYDQIEHFQMDYFPYKSKMGVAYTSSFQMPPSPVKDATTCNEWPSKISGFLMYVIPLNEGRKARNQ